MVKWQYPLVRLSRYATSYREARAYPFGFLAGQLLAFFGISLYVKLIQMRLTADYGGSWLGRGRFWVNSLHYLLFGAQEVALFAALLAAVALWRRYDSGAGQVSRAAAALLAFVLLPVLSVIEVLGLEHFALFLTPLGPEEARLIAWAGHVVSAGGALQSPATVAGLALIALAYYLTPLALWLRPRPDTPWRRPVAATVLAGLVLAALPKPPLADALLEPHPVLWLLFGGRPQRLWQGNEGIAATAPEAARGRPRFTVSERPTNVLLFVLESTSAASVALYNPAATAGRQLARWRDEMVLFEQIYAPVPTSGHAMFSILYGMYPYIGPFWTSTGKSVAAESLAQVFTRAGYASHFYITSDLNYDNIRSFVAPGFERVLDTNDWPGQEAYTQLPWGRDDRLLIEEIKRFITARDQRPFFLFAMTSNPHHPYDVPHLPPDPASSEPRQAHARLVDYNFDLLAELYDWLKQRGVAEQTLLLVLGDHGEAFGDHPGDFGHAAFIYVENMHVPCFILHPRRLGLPRRIAQLGSQVDLRATILDILGRHNDNPGTGMSLLREDAGRMVANFTENGVSHFGMRDQRFSYIYTPHVDSEQLFDRHGDPGELHNIAAREPTLTARYRERLRHWEAQHQQLLTQVLQ
ncbi:MAG: sulfatase-like hydrolase/transferase [Deltaproteobacteria bacterium]|nr:sulfatase-like hydrolase/transferase [Deltaproteobacteria bacterium]